MRTQTVGILAMLMAIGLSGCFGAEPTTDPTDPAGGCTEADRMNITNEACYVAAPANVVPDARLTMTDGTGRILNGSLYIIVGGNITFSAVGTTDPDGNITDINLTVNDANGTRTASLFDNMMFVNITLAFDMVGAANVTLDAFDDDGEISRINATIGVNLVTQDTLEFDSQAPSGSADACAAPGASSGAPPLITNGFAQKSTFGVSEGTQWISAKVTAGDAEIAICSPDGDALSEAGTDVATEDDTNSTMPINAQYYVMVLKRGSGAGEVAVEIIKHFEPKLAT